MAHECFAVLQAVATSTLVHVGEGGGWPILSGRKTCQLHLERTWCKNVFMPILLRVSVDVLAALAVQTACFYLQQGHRSLRKDNFRQECGPFKLALQEVSMSYYVASGSRRVSGLRLRVWRLVTNCFFAWDARRDFKSVLSAELVLSTSWCCLKGGSSSMSPHVQVPEQMLSTGGFKVFVVPSSMLGSSHPRPIIWGLVYCDCLPGLRASGLVLEMLLAGSTQRRPRRGASESSTKGSVMIFS